MSSNSLDSNILEINQNLDIIGSFNLEIYKQETQEKLGTQEISLHNGKDFFINNEEGADFVIKYDEIKQNYHLLSPLLSCPELEKFSDLTDAENISFNIKKITIDSQDNFVLSLDSSSNTKFSQIKFGANTISVKKKGEQKFEIIKTYKEMLNINLPSTYLTAMTNSNPNIVVKEQPAQVFDMLKNIELQANDVAVTTKEIKVGRTNLKLLKIENKESNISKLFLASKNKLVSFEPEKLNFYQQESKPEKIILSITLSGKEKGIGNTTSTKALALDNLSQKDMQTIKEFIGADLNQQPYPANEFGKVVNATKIKNSIERKKRIKSNLKNNNQTIDDKENLVKEIIQPEIIKDEEIQPDITTPESQKVDVENLQKEAIREATSQIKNEQENENVKIENEKPKSESVVDTKPDDAKTPLTPSSAEQKPKSASSEKVTYDLSIIVKMASLFLLVCSCLLGFGGLLLPTICYCLATTAVATSFVFDDKLSKVEFKKAKKSAKKSKDKDKKQSLKLKLQKIKEKRALKKTQKADKLLEENDSYENKLSDTSNKENITSDTPKDFANEQNINITEQDITKDRKDSDSDMILDQDKAKEIENRMLASLDKNGTKLKQIQNDYLYTTNQSHLDKIKQIEKNYESMKKCYQEFKKDYKKLNKLDIVNDSNLLEKLYNNCQDFENANQNIKDILTIKKLSNENEQELNQ